MFCWIDGLFVLFMQSNYLNRSEAFKTFVGLSGDQAYINENQVLSDAEEEDEEEELKLNADDEGRERLKKFIQIQQHVSCRY